MFCCNVEDDEFEQQIPGRKQRLGQHDLIVSAECIRFLRHRGNGPIIRYVQFYTFLIQIF